MNVFTLSLNKTGLFKEIHFVGGELIYFSQENKNGWSSLWTSKAVLVKTKNTKKSKNVWKATG